jgi:uncharacterized protein YkwD/LysM repeat protein
VYKFSLVFLLILGFVLVAPVGAQVPLSITANKQRVDTDPYSLINEVNILRAANGLPAYSINSILMAVAQQHAQYMTAAGVTHSGSGGSRPWQRGLAAGYPLAGDLSLGGFYSENIIAGRLMSVQEAVSAWQSDAPHLNTMLSANLREIGAGAALVGDYVYYVIDCAAPTNSGQAQALTPVPAGQTAVATTGPLVVNTILPATPLEDGKLVHVVKPGETLWLIAVSYGVKIVDLRRLNNLAETQAIFPGEKLLIRQELNPLPQAATPTVTLPATLQLTNTRVFTLMPTPTLLPTATLPLVASVSANSSLLVLGVIVVAALLLAVVIVRVGRKI